MSKYKFHSINSNRKIIKRTKNDLQGTILLTKKNKYKNLYSKLYDKRKRRFLRYFKRRRVLNFLIIANKKLLYLKKFNRYYFKKFNKFHRLHYSLTRKKKLKFYQNFKNLPHFFYMFKSQKKALNFQNFKKQQKILNLKNKKKYFSVQKNQIITKRKINFFFKFIKQKKFNLKKQFNFKLIKKLIKIKSAKRIHYSLNKVNFYKSLKIFKNRKLIKKIKFLNLKKKKRKINYVAKLRLKFKRKFRIKFFQQKIEKKIKKKIKNTVIKKLKKLVKNTNLFNSNLKKKKHKLNDLKYLLKNQFNNFDYYILKAKYGGFVPKFYKKILYNKKIVYGVKKPDKIISIFNIKVISLFKKKKKLNNFGRGLRQKEVLRRFLGNCSNKQLKSFFFYFKKFKNLKRNKLNVNFITNFFYNLESTLLFFLIRSKFFLMQLNQLKNFIEKNGILVNNKIINNPYFKLKVGDKINFNLHLYPFIKYHFLKNFSKYSKPLSHILISYSTLTFYYFKLPKLKELDFGFKFNPNLFRQLYKKNKYFNNLKLI